MKKVKSAADSRRHPFTSVYCRKIVMGNMAKGVQNISLMPDLSNVQDGNYTGEASIAPVYVKAAVSVKDHPITEFSILRHDNGLESTAGRIADDGMKE